MSAAESCVAQTENGKTPEFWEESVGPRNYFERRQVAKRLVQWTARHRDGTNKSAWWRNYKCNGETPDGHGERCSKKLIERESRNASRQGAGLVGWLCQVARKIFEMSGGMPKFSKQRRDPGASFAKMQGRHGDPGFERPSSAQENG